MTRDEAVELLKGRLARWNDTVLEPYILAEMKAAQVRLEEEPILPWFLLEEESYTDVSVGEDRIPVPENFICEDDDDALYIVISGVQTPLLKVDRENLSLLSGTPTEYAITGNYFRLGPVPDATCQLKMIYYRHDDPLLTNIENRWLKYAPDLLIAETGHVIASRYVRNDVAAAEFKSDSQRARMRMTAMDQARLDANRVYRSEN